MAQQVQYSFQLLPLTLLLFTIIYVSATATQTYPRSIRFDGMRRTMASEYSVHLPPEFVTNYYSQTLDHFNYKPESYATFQQKYIINEQYWGGANNSCPIFVYTGEEANVTLDVPNIGLIIDLAKRFKGLLLYIEHRYYGDSMPFGSKDEAYQNASTLGFFSSTQALADYAQLIRHLKETLPAKNCPVVAVGGSYGGMLAAWLRLKYPHITIGALASSAPILYFDNITPEDAYYDVVSKVYRESNESCYNTIKLSWSEIDRVAAEPNGLQHLSDIFNTCRPLCSSVELKNYLIKIYATKAQNNNPPSYPVREKICKAIDEASERTDILGRIAAGLNASYDGRKINCTINIQEYLKPVTSSGWTWQVCTEMVMPKGFGNNTMFQPQPFNWHSYANSCQSLFGVVPRRHWITTEFGGHNITSVLRNFASNIIFSNGLRDPYSVGGVLKDISDSVLAVYTEEGAHCLDLFNTSTRDPDWLVAQRNKEFDIIEVWIGEYHAKLLEEKKTGNGVGSEKQIKSQ